MTKQATIKPPTKRIKPLKYALLVYHGGGYSGCFFELNVCLFDQDGEWMDVYRSGCAAIKTETEARERATAFLKGTPIESTDDVVFFNVGKEVKRLNADYAASFVAGIVEKCHDDSDPKDKLCVICDVCGKKCYERYEDFHMVDYRGGGGITYYPRTKVCSDCYEAGSCEICKEHGEDEASAYCGKENLDENHLCSCHRGQVVFRLLEDGEINPDHPKGKEILELHKVIKKGELQVREMMQRFPNNTDLWNQHKVGIAAINKELTDLWESLDEMEISEVRL